MNDQPIDSLGFPSPGSRTDSDLPNRHLLAAETAAVNGQQVDAIRLYEQAINQAQDDKTRAQASEAFARFWLQWGNQRIAAVYLKDALGFYEKMGVTYKVEQLNSAYHDLLLAMGPERVPQTAKISTLPNMEQLVEAAQGIVGETHRDKIIAKLVDVALRDSGADRVVLILVDQERSGLYLEASKSAANRNSNHDSNQPLSNDSPVALEAVRCCQESLNCIIFNTVLEDQQLAASAYIQKWKPQSLLCSPLIAQGVLIGMLYLENHARTEVFNRQRVNICKLLSVMAAIALQRSQLQQRCEAKASEVFDLQRQLMVSQKMDSIGHLVGGVAHDFNNVINAIYGFCDLSLMELDEGAISEGEVVLRDNIQSTIESADRAASLARQLLLFSSQRAQQPVLLSLDKTITSLEKMLDRLLGEHCHLNLQFEQALSSLMGDPAQLEQVVLNLVLNAQDAMPEGGDITVALRNVAIDDEVFTVHPEMVRQAMVALIVTDTGQGMSEQVQSMIFEPFFTTKAVGHGTGLGLATTLNIVRKHQGYIYCNSGEGQGTTFTVYLPIADQAAESAGHEAIRELPRGHEQIVLVDDDDVVRHVTAQLLKKLGYGVTEFTNAEEALQFIGDMTNKMDLLVTDVMLPGMNGAQLSQQVQQQRPTTKVLYVSGYPDNFLGEKYSNIKDTLLLNKPFTIEAFAKAVRQLIDENIQP